MMIKAPILGINRLRFETDGPGITTLVAFMKCPLKCKYCINKECHDPLPKQDITHLSGTIKYYSPLELYNKVKIDNIYFQATNGGITFGGGEPALYSDFITEFRKICGDNWHLNIETSLNVDPKHIKALSSVINHFIIDIKDLNPLIYKKYTGASIYSVILNLLYLKKIGRAQDTTIRVPYIPGYNNPVDVSKSIDRLISSGFANIYGFDYITQIPSRDAQESRREAMDPEIEGKEICEELSKIRKEIASINGLELHSDICNYIGDCAGTCPKCDWELQKLQKQLDEKCLKGENLNYSLTNKFSRKKITIANLPPLLEGKIVDPLSWEAEVSDLDLI